MRFNPRLIFLLICLPCLGWSDEPSDLSLHVRAYSMMIHADQARDDHHWREAILQYRQAVELYGQLAQKEPDWHPDVAQFRLSYCQNEIAAIVKKTKVSEEKWVAMKSGSSVEQQSYRALYEEALDENKRLEKELDAVRDELNKMQMQVGQLQHQWRDLQDEQDVSSTNSMREK